MQLGRACVRVRGVATGCGAVGEVVLQSAAQREDRGRKKGTAGCRTTQEDRPHWQALSQQPTHSLRKAHYHPDPIFFQAVKKGTPGAVLFKKLLLPTLEKRAQCQEVAIGSKLAIDDPSENFQRGLQKNLCHDACQ